MPDFSEVQIGDKLERKCYGHGLEAEVISIDDKTITCEVLVDVPRVMVFDRKTGIHIRGDRFGYLKFPSQTQANTEA